MNLILNRLEIGVLMFNMSIMRKNIKKVLKGNYGKAEGKDLLKVYDGIKTTLQQFFNITNDENDIIIDFKDNEINVLHSFISSYVPQLEKTFKDADHKVSQDDQAQINAMKMVRGKIEMLANNE